MRKGDLVKWQDPGKAAVGVVLETPATYNLTTRVGVSWFSDGEVRISYPKLMEIKLAEPRKVNS